MIQIRRNVFETNSSSTHSITMCTEQDYIKFSRGDVYLVDWKSAPKSMMTFEEVMEFLESNKLMDIEDAENVKSYYSKKDMKLVEEYLAEYRVYTLNTFNCSNFEEFYDEYRTPSGETVVAFGYYGEDY